MYYIYIIYIYIYIHTHTHVYIHTHTNAQPAAGEGLLGKQSLAGSDKQTKATPRRIHSGASLARTRQVLN